MNHFGSTVKTEITHSAAINLTDQFCRIHSSYPPQVMSLELPQFREVHQEQLEVDMAKIDELTYLRPPIILSIKPPLRNRLVSGSRLERVLGLCARRSVMDSWHKLNRKLSYPFTGGWRRLCDSKPSPRQSSRRRFPKRCEAGAAGCDDGDGGAEKGG